MPRSSGPRPSPEVREEVAQLRARLAECRSRDWAKAYRIFAAICALCNHSGSKGGNGTPYPRACAFCDRYGHSTQFCKALKVWQAQKAEKEKDKELAAEARWAASLPRVSTLPAYWAEELRLWRERYEAACEAGLEGCLMEWERGACEANGVPENERCAGCKQWEGYMCEHSAHAPKP